MASSSADFPTTLAQLQSYTNVVSDTPEFDIIAPYTPTDVTTNPTNILVASRKERFKWIVDETLAYARSEHGVLNNEAASDAQVMTAYRRLLVGFGAQVSSHITGFVATQIDPSLAHNTEATIAEARSIIALYESMGVPKEKVMIKVPAIWEGLQAVRILERDYDIRCTMTLVQSIVQATAAAEVGATMISPFASRTLDWWVQHAPGKDFSGPKCPGVKLCGEIQALYRKKGYKTKLMACARSVDQCAHLAGIDALSLNPNLLEELRTSYYKVDNRHPIGESANVSEEPPSNVYLHNEVKFQGDYFQDEPAFVKVAEGLRIFQKDAEKLKAFLQEQLQAQ